jgi:uncharacterized protein (TIRG00374 family)
MEAGRVKRWQFWVGLVVSGALLWLALRGLQPAQIWSALQGANYWWLIPGVAVYFLGVWARAWRWHYLLRPLKAVPAQTMFPIVAIGYMGNNIYPARAGELLRAYVLRRKEEIPISASLATIIVERAFDGVVMLSFVFINLPRLAGLTAASGFAGSIRDLAIWGAALFFLAVALFLWMASAPQRAQRLVNWACQRFIPGRLWGQVMDASERFIGGLASLRSPRDVFMILLTSVVIWLLETGKYWFVMHAFTFKVSFFALMLMNGVVNLATTIPSAPGYIGTFDAPGIAILEAFAVPRNVAAGYTLVLHGALWFPITILGGYFMARESLSWGQVREEIAEGGG